MSQSMLEFLKDERIFSITKVPGDDAFIIWEECDRNFKVGLTRDELKQLAQEILELAEPLP